MDGPLLWWMEVLATNHVVTDMFLILLVKWKCLLTFHSAIVIFWFHMTRQTELQQLHSNNVTTKIRKRNIYFEIGLQVEDFKIYCFLYAIFKHFFSFNS